MDNSSYWKYIDIPTCLGDQPDEFTYILQEANSLSTTDKERITNYNCMTIKDQTSTGDCQEDASDLKQKIVGDLDLKHGIFAWLATDGDPTNFYPLGSTNRFDRFVWDIVLRAGMTHLQVLTLFTSQVQANYYLVWNKSGGINRFYCSFFELASPDTLSLKDQHFFRLLNVKELLEPKIQLNELIYWNQYVITKPVDSNQDNGKLGVRRQFVALRQESRSLFNNVPLVTSYINESHVDVMKESLFVTQDKKPAALKSANSFYAALAEQNSWVVGVGAPMLYNLDQLGNAMSNSKADITLVTGLPGTGKENYMKALHFAETNCSQQISSNLVISTALDFEGPDEADKKFIHILAEKFNICASNNTNNRNSDCQNKKRGRGGRHTITTVDKVSFVIDELNKASELTRSSLLRILENPYSFCSKLKTFKIEKVKFILAASDHLDRLAQDPPQDFWTRITNQMRVVHPLGQVSERDAEDFLTAFFWFNWWVLAKEWLGETAGTGINGHSLLIRQILGKKLKPDVQSSGIDQATEGTYDMPSIVCEEFVQTLAPITVRDQISIRGLRSIMRQVFSNVIWSTRYGLVPSRHADDPFDRLVRRSVNHAIQDVVAILNAARSTPRTAKG